MKLYFSPGACSLSPHIVAREAGITLEIHKVDLKTGQMDGGGDFTQVNAKGYVPALRLDDGALLTEGPAIIQYLADSKPESGLAPQPGTLERYHLQEWLNFISTEVHKQFVPLFHPASADWKAAGLDNLTRRFDWITQQLAGKTWLMGDRFTVADAYLFTVLNWCQWVEVDLAKWPVLKAYADRVAARPKVQEALKAEGLVQ